MTLGELSALPRHALLRRLREAEARAERAEMRLARRALAEAFGALDLDRASAGYLYAEPCRCGHKRDSHTICEGQCDLCDCAAFVAREPAP